ncbi:hypothetical protein IHE44_0013769 [Lamprotornis superbus]|uniref:Uncharacterized protein n=1 Tax=Lamprotornis superbus TaxID=245042 RepID=A0A835NRX0_9PASS|nr:hypothetical protein IHE44_0013769 [Lamprotornis superbus]
MSVLKQSSVDEASQEVPLHSVDLRRESLMLDSVDIYFGTRADMFGTSLIFHGNQVLKDLVGLTFLQIMLHDDKCEKQCCEGGIGTESHHDPLKCVRIEFMVIESFDMGTGKLPPEHVPSACIKLILRNKNKLQIMTGSYYIQSQGRNQNGEKGSGLKLTADHMPSDLFFGLAKFVRLTALETYAFCRSLRQMRGFSSSSTSVPTKQKLSSTAHLCSVCVPSPSKQDGSCKFRECQAVNYGLGIHQCIMKIDFIFALLKFTEEKILETMGFTLHSIYFTWKVSLLLGSLLGLCLGLEFLGIPNQWARYLRWDASTRSELSFQFKTNVSAGLLLYFDDGGVCDFLCLSLVDGRIQLQFSVDCAETTVITDKQVNDSSWHFLMVSRNHLRTVLVLDGEAKPGEVRPQRQYMNIVSDLFIGGVPLDIRPAALTLDGVLSEPPFQGFILDLKYGNSEPQLLGSQGVRLEMEGLCSENPCENGGTCFLLDGEPHCDCSATGYAGKLCSEVSLLKNIGLSTGYEQLPFCEGNLHSIIRTAGSSGTCLGWAQIFTHQCKTLELIISKDCGMTMGLQPFSSGLQVSCRPWAKVKPSLDIFSDKMKQVQGLTTGCKTAQGLREVDGGVGRTVDVTLYLKQNSFVFECVCSEMGLRAEYIGFTFCATFASYAVSALQALPACTLVQLIILKRDQSITYKGSGAGQQNLNGLGVTPKKACPNRRFCCGMADKQDVHKMLHDINSQEDALNCFLTGKSSGSGSNINPVALYLQAGNLPHQTFDTQQLLLTLSRVGWTGISNADIENQFLSAPQSSPYTGVQSESNKRMLEGCLDLTGHAPKALSHKSLLNILKMLMCVAEEDDGRIYAEEITKYGSLILWRLLLVPGEGLPLQLVSLTPYHRRNDSHFCLLNVDLNVGLFILRVQLLQKAIAKFTLNPVGQEPKELKMPSLTLRTTSEAGFCVCTGPCSTHAVCWFFSKACGSFLPSVVVLNIEALPVDVVTIKKSVAFAKQYHTVVPEKSPSLLQYSRKMHKLFTTARRAAALTLRVCPENNTQRVQSIIIQLRICPARRIVEASDRPVNIGGCDVQAKAGRSLFCYLAEQNSLLVPLLEMINKISLWPDVEHDLPKGTKLNEQGEELGKRLLTKYWSKSGLHIQEKQQGNTNLEMKQHVNAKLHFSTYEEMGVGF